MSLENKTIPLVRCLPDYEILSFVDGTPFTPELKLGGGDTGMTYAVQKGFYQVIGDYCIVDVNIQLTAKGTSTGNVTIENLPFPCVTEAGYIAVCAEPYTLRTTAKQFMRITSGANAIEWVACLSNGNSTNFSQGSVTDTGIFHFQLRYKIA